MFLNCSPIVNVVINSFHILLFAPGWNSVITLFPSYFHILNSPKIVLSQYYAKVLVTYEVGREPHCYNAWYKTLSQRLYQIG